jgi:5-methyltetrahydrofolate--homocysteine methyltransferase
MNERGINVPVILGGAALNRRYVDNDLIPLYKGQLFYARDAFDGLHAMDELTSDTESKAQSQKSKVAAAGAKAETRAVAGVPVEIQTVGDAEDLVGEDAKLGAVAARVSTRSAGSTTHTTRSDIRSGVEIPKAPFYGSKVVEIKDLTKVFDFINETALFKGQWQFKQGRKSKEEYDEILKETVYPKFAEIKGNVYPE